MISRYSRGRRQPTRAKLGTCRTAQQHLLHARQNEPSSLQYGMGSHPRQVYSRECASPFTRYLTLRADRQDRSELLCYVPRQDQRSQPDLCCLRQVCVESPCPAYTIASCPWFAFIDLLKPRGSCGPRTQVPSSSGSNSYFSSAPPGQTKVCHLANAHVRLVSCV